MASGIEHRTQLAANRDKDPAYCARGVGWRSVVALSHCFALSMMPTAAATQNQPGGAADAALARAIRSVAQPLTGAPADYDRLLGKIGNARIVLLGEDTHGTHEFYVERARITRRLVAERGFASVVIEGDWSDAAGLRAFLTDADHRANAETALRAFERFPRWMWGNTDFRDLLSWLRRYNLQRDAGRHPVAIHGMDLYEVGRSVAAVIGYLDQTNPGTAAKARERYLCLTSANKPGSDGGVPAHWPDSDCGVPVQAQLTDMVTGAFAREPGEADIANFAYLHALQSARVVRNAEEYFRAMRRVPDNSWNLRDSHMASSVDLLLAHLDAATGARSRIVVWAHNAHVGDARATATGETGGLTLGQLLRERYPGDVIIVGFSTATGTVRAATDWGGPDRRKRLRRPIAGSHAALFHATGLAGFYVIPGDSPAVHEALGRPRPQRGIGVRYLPKLELAGHYYDARLSAQADAWVHVDRSTALRAVPPQPAHGKPPL